MDNRLDFISNLKDGTVEKMTALRKKFIDLDNELKDLLLDQKLDENNPALNRCVALARTHIEEALMYAIKSLCLKHEKMG